MSKILKKMHGLCLQKFNQACSQLSINKHKALDQIDRQYYHLTGRALRFDWMYPAKNVEDTYGLSDISAEYLMPDNKTMRQVALQLQYSDKENSHLKNYNDLLDKIIKLNPELGTVTYDRNKERNVLDVIFGATSGFNIDDINYFIETGSHGIPGKLSKGEQDRFLNTQAYDKKLNIRFEWIPSPQTLKKIKEQRGVAPDWEPSKDDLQEIIDEMSAVNQSFKEQFDCINSPS